jgi:hypothetical protein
MSSIRGISILDQSVQVFQIDYSQPTQISPTNDETITRTLWGKTGLGLLDLESELRRIKKSEESSRPKQVIVDIIRETIGKCKCYICRRNRPTCDLTYVLFFSQPP